jgi:hypothetical protein
MRRATTIGLIGLVLLLSAARPASAQWRIIKWLEELSGPGHMVVQQLEIRFGCRWKDQPEQGKEREAFSESMRKAPLSRRLIFCDLNSTPREDASKYKGQPALESVHSFFTVTGTAKWFTGTGTNPLEYPPDTKKAHPTVWGLSGGWAYRLSEVTDLGFTAGFLRLSGRTETTTTAFVSDLYTVLRPLATLGPRWDQLIEVRLVAQVFPKGFTLADFGADSGSLNGEFEIITQVGIAVNIPVIVRAFKK